MPGRRSTRASKADDKDAGEMDTAGDAPKVEAMGGEPVNTKGDSSTASGEAATEAKETRGTKQEGTKQKGTQNKKKNKKQQQQKKNKKKNPKELQQEHANETEDQAQGRQTRRQQNNKKNKKTKKSQQQEQQKKGQRNGGKPAKTNTQSQQKTNKQKPPPPTASVILLGEDHLLAKLQELADGENLQELQVTLLKAFAQPHHEASLLSSLRTVPFQTAATLLQQCTEALRLMFDASRKELKALAGSKMSPSLSYAITFVNTLIDAHLAGLLTDVACEPMLRDLASLIARYEDLCLQMHQMDGMLHHLRREQRLRGPLARKGKKGMRRQEEQKHSSGKKKGKKQQKQQQQRQLKKDEKSKVTLDITETAVQQVTRTYTMETLELV